MGFAWLEWLFQCVKVLGDLIPRRVLVEPTHKAVKFKGMKNTIVLHSGRYWYIPFFSTVYIIPVVRQSMYLKEQDITTLDGKPVKLRATVAYEVSDIKTALVNCFEFLEQIDDESMGIISRYCSTKTFDELRNDRPKFNRALTRLVGTRMLEYGVTVKRVQVISFITGMALLHIGITQNQTTMEK